MEPEWVGVGDSGSVYALINGEDLSLLQVNLDGAFSEHGFSVPTTLCRGALARRHSSLTLGRHEPQHFRGSGL